MNPQAAAAAVPVLNGVDWAAHMAAWQVEPEDDEPDAPYSVEGGMAVMDLRGPMTRGETSMSALFGGVSTVAARRAIRQAANDPTIGGIMLRFDSPGGEVDGTAELAQDIAAANGRKPVLAYVDGACDSAAFWAASQCAEVWGGPTSRVGSIGTYTTLEDSSDAARAAGFTVHVVRSAANKGIGVPGAPISDANVSRVQETVDGLNEEFLAAVGRGRKMTPEAVGAVADGEEFHARRAVENGLMDAIGSEEEAMAHLRALAAKRGGNRMDVFDKMRAMLGGEPRGLDAEPTVALETATTTLATGTITEHPLVAACRAANITDPGQLAALAANAQLGDQYTAAMRAEAKAEYTRAMGPAAVDPERIAAIESATFADAKNLRDIYRDAADAKFGTSKDAAVKAVSAPSESLNVALDVAGTTDADKAANLDRLKALTPIGRMAAQNGKGH
jgi:signal peptide peptidase SppA